MTGMPCPLFRTPNPGRAGGLKRVRMLSAEQRSELARKGGDATQRLYGRGYYSALAKHGYKKRKTND